MANEFHIKRGFVSEGNGTITGSLTVTQGVTGSFSGSFQGDGSGLTGVEPFPFTGSALITGSLDVTGSTVTTQIGVGAPPDGTTRLDVRAQGALSTDIAFRVRNSADNRTPFSILGNEITQISSDGIAFAGSALPLNIKSSTSNYSSWLGMDIEHTVRTGYFSVQSQGLQNNYNNVRFSSGGSKAGAKISAYITQTNTDRQGHWQFRTQVHLGDSIRTYNNNFGFQTLVIENATAPTATPTDGFVQYSADITEDNAAPHFRTENGDIIKLYKEIQPALSGSANTGDAATDALIEAMKTIILNLGLGASS